MFTTVAASVTGGVQKFAHGLQFAMLIAMTTNIIQWVSGKVQTRTGSHCFVQYPTYLLALASILMLVQPTCLFISDCWRCDGAFSADQLHGSAVLCTHRDPRGELHPRACSGWYEMDGRFVQNPLVASQFDPVSSRIATIYPGGCSEPIGSMAWAQHAAGIFGLPVSYTHLRAHETPEHLVCRLLLEKKKKWDERHTKN
eukprot:TRINITY_DN49064_c0_g1_i1.p1 TRINITY_DN49064_c0_g1~~TRINITY_DN49064_c0_g1_i1.p1  ORF type:complete len:199 (+),score=31.68 TRINITY_DN49064_c0_g1_i1:422-1018(+)